MDDARCHGQRTTLGTYNDSGTLQVSRYLYLYVYVTCCSRRTKESTRLLLVTFWTAVLPLSAWQAFCRIYSYHIVVSYQTGLFATVRAVASAPRGTVWDRLARRRWEKNKGIFLRDGMGKGSCLFTAGWEWDGKVGSHLVDGMGRDSRRFFW